MRASRFDCVVLDLRLPDMSGFELLEAIQRDPALRRVPIIVFTGRDLSDAEEIRLRKSAKSIVLKGVRSPERLLDETALFLHRVVADLPESRQADMLRHCTKATSRCRPQGAGRRRRHPQHLRPQQPARTSPHGGRHRHQRPGGHQAGRKHRGPVAGAHGRDDAGDGRLRDHAPDPHSSSSSGCCRSSR